MCLLYKFVSKDFINLKVFSSISEQCIILLINIKECLLNNLGMNLAKWASSF